MKIKIINISFFLLLIFVSDVIIAESTYAIDSLRQFIGNTKNHSEKYDALVQLFDLTKNNDFGIAEIYGQKALKQARSNKDVFGEANMYNKLGLEYASNYNYEKAMTYYDLSKNLFEQINEEEMVGVIYNNMGLNYGYQQETGKELIYHHKALTLFNKIKSESRQAMSYINIGNVYAQKDDLEKALNYYKKAQPIYEKFQDYKRLATCLNNISLIYYNKKNYLKSYETFQKTLKVYELLGNARGTSMILYNMASPLMKLKRYDEAEERLTRALKIVTKENDNNGIAICNNNFGALNLELGNYNKAEEFYLLSNNAALKARMIDLATENYSGLWKVYEKKGDYINAFKYYKKYAEINDSIHNKQIEKINEVERKLIANKNKQELELLNKESEIKSYQTKVTIIIGIGLILLLFIGIFSLFKKYQNKNKSNKLLEEKNHLIEEKSKEITDSINYAKRIQSAILPPDKFIKEHLPHSFVLYKPKDIVAGDFYWLVQQDGKILFAAADCTGHGVPGAMVSVVCNSGLYQSVREHNILDPGKILDKTREIIVNEFEKAEEAVMDGMDIALCSLKFLVQKPVRPLVDSELPESTINSKPETVAILQYAGAHNPLWIVRKGELIEIKANKQPIGKFDNSEPFTTHTIEMQKDDLIYIFSDGYIDQFGGEKGKKFKGKAFRELLLSVCDKSMDDQKNILENSFATWRGKLEQVDDVCIIGVKV